MARIHRFGLPAAIVLLVATGAWAADSQELLSRALGREVKLDSSVLMAMFFASFPIGMLAVWMAMRLFEVGEELGGKAFVVAFFQRLMLGVAIWCIALIGIDKLPIPQQGVGFLTSFVVATVALRFGVSEPIPRIAAMALVFCLIDGVLLALALLASLAAFG